MSINESNAPNTNQVTVTTAVTAIGGMDDFAGVGDFHDAGGTQWIKTNTWIDASLLDSAARARIRKDYKLAALAKNLGMSAFMQLSTLVETAKNSVAASFPMRPFGSAAMYALTIDATGVTYAPVGGNVGFNNAVGGGSLITSDGTTLFNWTAATGGTTLSLRTSTDGKTWGSATLSGLPAFVGTDLSPIGPGATGGNQQAGTGDSYSTGTATPMQIMFYAGARHLFIGSDGTNLRASRSTTGLAWGGDETTAVIGGTVAANATAAFWYRNPGTPRAYFNFGNGASRYTDDGGVTWAATNMSGYGNQPHRINSSDGDRIAICTGTTTFFSTNCGRTFTSRTLPVNPTTLYGRGSTWVISDGLNAYRSTDDGANWTLIIGISGLLGTVLAVFADANRFYLLTTGNQLYRSTDAVTWLLCNIGNPMPTLVGGGPVNASALDSNNVVFTQWTSDANVPALITTDGGATAYWCLKGSAVAGQGNGSYTAMYKAVPFGGGYLVGGSIGQYSGGSPGLSRDTALIVSAADLAAGGAQFRSTSAAVSPLRTGATAYTRIG